MARMIRDPTQQYELPADQADTRIQALTMEGRAVMPASRIAMTQGELLAFPVPETRSALRGSTINPIKNAPRI